MLRDDRNTQKNLSYTVRTILLHKIRKLAVTKADTSSVSCRSVQHNKRESYLLRRVSVFVVQKEAAGDHSIALSSVPTSTKFSFSDDDDDDDVSSLRRRSLSGLSDASNKRGVRVNGFERPAVSAAGHGRSTHARRYARDLSYFDDGNDEQRLRDILERLESQEARLSKRQPIDRIDEPSEWRDRLRIMRPRQSLDRFSLPVFFEGRNKRQPFDDRIICWG